MSRKKARESAVLLLYHWDMTDGDSSSMHTTLDETVMGVVIKNETLSDDDDQYLQTVLEGIRENVQHIDETKEAEAVGWKINRLPKVDLAVLRLGVYEILYRADIPDAVTINECVELAKHYSTENSGTFVNGVLSTVMKKKSADGQ
jgi:N utilization substance protein B